MKRAHSIKRSADLQIGSLPAERELADREIGAPAPMRGLSRGNLALLAWLLISAAMGCSTAKKPTRMVTLPDPETVLVTYHVMPGHEAELERLLAQSWKLYQSERMVVPDPHIVVHGPDGEGKTRYVELFTWTSHTVPDHAPASVTALWGKMTALCENRDGHNGLEGGEVHFVQPPK